MIPATAGPDGSLDLLTGAQRAAALLMLLGEEDGKAIWSELSNAEAKLVYVAMAELGAVRGEAVAQIADEFMGELGSSAVLGSLERAQELLAGVFPQERVSAIMSDVKVVPGRQVWKRLGEVPPEALATFLAGEYPQTIAVVLSRISAEQGGRVLALLPEDLALEVIDRTLHIADVRLEAVDALEEALHREFLAKAPGKARRDLYDVMAERFDVFDRPTEARVLAALEKTDSDIAIRIRERMFTFDDLLKLDAAGVQTLMRQIDKDTMARALKGATDVAREFFQANMSSRAAKNFQDDMESLGPIRVKEVDEAQSRMVQAAKALAATGEIRIPKGRVEEDMVG